MTTTRSNNVLLNGSEAGQPPPPAVEAETFPTWGYKAGGASAVFDLKSGEKLPDGWSDAPVHEVSTDEAAPKKAKAKKTETEAVTEETNGDSDGN